MSNYYDLGYSNFLTINSLKNEGSSDLITSANVDAMIESGGVGFEQTTMNVLNNNEDMQSGNFISGSNGWQIKGNGDVEFNSGVFRGTLTAGELHIPDENTTANSFHVESDGDTFWGCTQSDFTSDNDNAKAYVLSTGVAKFQEVTIGTGNSKMVYDPNATTLTSTNQIITHPFTAGENLTAHKMVCFKFGTLTDSLADNSDAEVRQDDPAANFGTADPITIGNLDNNQTGDKKREAYFAFESLPSNINSAEFSITVTQKFGGGTNVEVTLYTLDAGFDDTTLTWNNVPASTIVAGSATTIATTTTYTWDITNYIVGLQRTGGTFHGLALRVSGGVANNWFRIIESAPFISLILNGSDQKVYLADRDDYATSRFVIGKTLEGVSADESVLVQVGGIMDNITTVAGQAGYPVMLMDDGNTGSQSLPRIIDRGTGAAFVKNVELGIALTSTTMLFNINRGTDFYIDNESITSSGSGQNWTYTTYPPLLARKCIIEWSNGVFVVYKDSAQTTQQQDTDTNGGNDFSVELSADWSSIVNQIDLAWSYGVSSAPGSAPTAIAWYYE